MANTDHLLLVTVAVLCAVNFDPGIVKFAEAATTTDVTIGSRRETTDQLSAISPGMNIAPSTETSEPASLNSSDLAVATGGSSTVLTTPTSQIVYEQTSHRSVISTSPPTSETRSTSASPRSTSYLPGHNREDPLSRARKTLGWWAVMMLILALTLVVVTVVFVVVIINRRNGNPNEVMPFKMSQEKSPPPSPPRRRIIPSLETPANEIKIPLQQTSPATSGQWMTTTHDADPCDVTPSIAPPAVYLPRDWGNGGRWMQNPHGNVRPTTMSIKVHDMEYSFTQQ